MRVRMEHWQLILSVCEENPLLLTNRFRGPEGRAKGNALWQSVAAKLNSLGFGEKNVDGWRKTLTDWKCKTKAKAAALKREQQQTGGGPPELPPLSSLEETLLKLMGAKAINGDEVVPELGFGRVEIPKNIMGTTKKHSDKNINISACENECENEVVETSPKPSTSQGDHDYEQKCVSDNNLNINLKRKSKWQDERPKKYIKIKHRPNNGVHLSNELLNLNAESIELLRNINNNTKDISNSLANISTNTKNIADSLSEIANILKTNSGSS